jgi:hypothetical protein
VPAPPSFLNAWDYIIAIVVSELVLGLPTYGATVHGNGHERITSTRNIWEDVLVPNALLIFDT